MSLLHFISSTFSHVLAASLLGSVLALLILAMQRVFHTRLGPAWRHALWSLVLLRLLVPSFPETSFSLFNTPRWIQLASAPERRVSVSFLDLPAFLDHPALATSDTSVSPTTHLPAAPTSHPRGVWRNLSVLWAAVTAILFLRLFIASAWLRLRLRRGSKVLDPALVSSSRLQMRCSCCPPVVETSCVASPGLFGLLRPRILLPSGLAQQLSAMELRHIFLHEFAHLKRRDLWTNLLMTTASALHWFNPVVWFVLRRLRVERELACDAMALRASPSAEALAYGNTILTLLESLPARPRLNPILGILEDKQTAASRLQQIAQFPSRPSPSTWLGILLSVTLALLGLSNAQTTHSAADAEQIWSPPLNQPLNLFAVGADSSRATLAITNDTRAIQQGLYTRTYRLPPNTFAAGLDGVYLSQNPFLQYASTPSNYFKSEPSNDVEHDPTAPIGVTTKPGDTPDIQAAVRDFFTAAGAKLDTDARKAIFFNNHTGILFVRADLQDLDRVETALQKLNAKSAQVQPQSQIRSNHGPTRASANDHAGTPAMIALTDVPPHQPGLYTRTYKVVPDTFPPGLSVTDQPDVATAVRKFFDAAGITNFAAFSDAQFAASEGTAESGRTQQQKAMFYNSNKGVLFVRGNLRDLDRVESALQSLTGEPAQVQPQVQIEASFVEFKPGAAYEQELALRTITTNQVQHIGTASELMTDPQFKALTEALNQRASSAFQSAGEERGNVFTGILARPEIEQAFQSLKSAEGVTVLAAPRITTIGTRAARISIDPGPSLSVLATVEPDMRTINLTAAIEIPPNQSATPELKTGTKERLQDGETLVVRAVQPHGITHLIFITPTLMDPTGKPIHPRAEK